MSALVRKMDAALYPGVTDNWDDKAFRERILTRLDSGRKEVLDLGAGAGLVAQMDFRAEARRVTGVDPDPRVLENPLLHEGKIGTGESIPFHDESFDLVVANNLLEHLSRPETVLREVHRVLRPGGWFMAKTPNRFHYVPLIASCTPHRFHEWVNRRRGRNAEDTYPTRYRANTVGALRQLAAAVGFADLRLELMEGRPEYLRFNAPAYLLGWAYERAVNRLPLLGGLRVVLMAELRK